MIKKFEYYGSQARYGQVNLSDLGNNWSATHHLNKREGLLPYIKSSGGIFIPVDDKKSIPQTAIYLKPEQVEEYNRITEEINRLDEQRKKILK